LEGGENEAYVLNIFGLEDTEVTINLNSLKGSAHLYVKKCVKETQVVRCALTEDDIKNRDALVK
jgi:hypothetical protein